MDASMYDSNRRQQEERRTVCNSTQAWCLAPCLGRSLVKTDQEQTNLHQQSIILKTTEQTAASEESRMALVASKHILAALMNGATSCTTSTSSTLSKNNNIIPRKLDRVESFGPMDILAGRVGKPKEGIVGKGHPGTKIFEQTIAKNLRAYQVLGQRKDRSHVIKKVVAELLSQGCRFLKYDGRADKFLVLDEKQIRDKVSFAFRHQNSKYNHRNASSTNKRNVKNESSSKGPRRPASFLSLQHPRATPQQQRKPRISQEDPEVSDRVENDERDFVDILEDVWADDLSEAANRNVRTSFDFLDTYELPGTEFTFENVEDQYSHGSLQMWAA